jgi:hypothetical protein
METRTKAKEPVEIMLESLKNHIPNLKKQYIIVWLKQAEKQFGAEITTTERNGLILKIKNSHRHIGPIFFGKTMEEKQVNMFHCFIQYHYGFINDKNQFVANLNFQDTYKIETFKTK